MLNLEQIFNTLQCCYTCLVAQQVANIEKLIIDPVLDEKVARAYSLIHLKVDGFIGEDDLEKYNLAVARVCNTCDCGEGEVWIGIGPICEDDGVSPITTTTSTSTTTTSTSTTSTTTSTSTTKSSTTSSTTTTTTTRTTTSTSTSSSTTSTTTAPVDNRCQFGPILNNLSNTSANGTDFLFDGQKVYSISWRVAQTGTTVRNGIITPTSNTPHITFNPPLPSGDYTLDIKGSSCESDVSSKEFSIGATQLKFSTVPYYSNVSNYRSIIFKINSTGVYPTTVYNNTTSTMFYENQNKTYGVDENFTVPGNAPEGNYTISVGGVTANLIIYAYQEGTTFLEYGATVVIKNGFRYSFNQSRGCRINILDSGYFNLTVQQERQSVDYSSTCYPLITGSLMQDFYPDDAVANEAFKAALQSPQGLAPKDRMCMQIYIHFIPKPYNESVAKLRQLTNNNTSIIFSDRSKFSNTEYVSMEIRAI